MKCSICDKKVTYSRILVNGMLMVKCNNIECEMSQLFDYDILDTRDMTMKEVERLFK